MGRNLFDSGDIIIKFKEVEADIANLWCFVEKCCKKIPVNIGNGIGLFKRLYREQWEFKSLIAGTNITITDNGNDLTISATGDVVQFNCDNLLTCSTSSLPEGTNLYYTDARARAALSAGTGISYDNVTGVITNTSPSSGGTVTNFTATNAAPLFTTTVTNSTTTPNLQFNISSVGSNRWYGNNTLGVGLPIFNLAGSLTELISSVLTITGTNTLLGNTSITVKQASTLDDGYLSAADWNLFNSKGDGTVTSVSMTVPVGFSVAGSPITTSGSLDITLDAGYIIPTTTEQTDWNTAYTNRITSLTTTGNSGAATLISNTLNIPDYTIDGLLPSQAGNSGKYLTTNGTIASWATVAGGGGAISALTAATATNTINNGNFLQEWQWNTLDGNSALKLSSTSTAASSNLQKLLELTLSGTNATSAQTTYGIYSLNTHAGTTSTNVAGYFQTSGGTTANYALLGVSSSGAGDNAGRFIGGAPCVYVNQNGGGAGIEIVTTNSTEIVFSGSLGANIYQSVANQDLITYTNGGGLYFSTNALSSYGLTVVNNKVFAGGVTSATARLHIAAGTASATTAPLKFTSGTVMTTGETGAMEYSGTNLFFTRTGTTRETVFTGNDAAAAPATNTIGVVVDYYGTSATRVLTTPNSWASVVVNGTTYKIPLYL